MPDNEIGTYELSVLADILHFCESHGEPYIHDYQLPELPSGKNAVMLRDFLWKLQLKDYVEQNSSNEYSSKTKKEKIEYWWRLTEKAMARLQSLPPPPAAAQHRPTPVSSQGPPLVQIFISYSRPDEASAMRLHDELKRMGHHPWIDKEKLLPGQRWRTEIVRAIKTADFVSVLFSSASISRDGFYQREIRICLDVLQEKAASKVWLIPVRLDTCLIPSEVEDYQYVDLFPNWDRGVERLLQSIQLQTREKGEVAEQIDRIMTVSSEMRTTEQHQNIHLKLLQLLKDAGCKMEKQTSGSHQLWQSPTNGTLFVVPISIGGRRIANSVLLQAGLPPQF